MPPHGSRGRGHLTVASVVCCRPTACCWGHAGRCYGAASVRNLPQLPVGQAWACGLACRADWQGWNLPAAPDSMAQRADGQRPSAQLLEPLGPVRDAPLTALRMRACPCCVPPSSLPHVRGADTMPAVVSVFGVRVDMMLKNCVSQCRCAGTLSPWRPPLPCTQHGRRRGRRHARPPYRAEVLTLDPLTRRSALARSEHSPTLRERVVRSIAVMASAWREVRARAWRACNQRPQGTGHFRTLFFKVRRVRI